MKVCKVFEDFNLKFKVNSDFVWIKDIFDTYMYNFPCLAQNNFHLSKEASSSFFNTGLKLKVILKKFFQVLKTLNTIFTSFSISIYLQAIPLKCFEGS